MTQHEYCVLDKFAGGLLCYIDTYFSSVNGVVYRPSINYTLPNADYISKNSDAIIMEIQSLKPIKDLSPELKGVACQYLSEFINEYPQYEKEECLKI